MLKLNSQQIGSAYVLLSGFLYGLVGYFGVSIVAENISISTMLFWRFVVSTIFISVILLFKKQPAHLLSKQSLNLFFFGSIFYSGTSGLYFLSSKYIGTGLAMVLFFTYPAIIVIFNWLYKKDKLSRNYCISIALLCLGIAMLGITKSATFNLYGVLLAILSAIHYSLYIIFSKKISTQMSPMSSTLIVSIGGSLGCFIFSLVDNTLMIPTSWSSWINIAGIGIICTALPILMLLKGLEYISSAKAAILSVLEPVCVAISGVFLLGEHLSFFQIIGTITILVAASITQFPDKK